MAATTPTSALSIVSPAKLAEQRADNDGHPQIPLEEGVEVPPTPSAVADAHSSSSAPKHAPSPPKRSDSLSARTQRFFESLVSPRNPDNPQESPSLVARLTDALSRTISALTPRQAPETPTTNDVPASFMAYCNGNARRAKAMYIADLQWRKEQNIVEILSRPYAKWDVVKQFYPQVMHLRGINGEPVSIEQPGKLDLDALKARGVGASDMAMHIAILIEFMFTHLENNPEGQFLTIMDCKDLSIVKAASMDYLNLIRATTEMLDKHYPGRAKKILLVNTPMMFGGVFKLIRGVLPGNMGTVVEVVGVKELTKYIATDNLPVTLGGKSTLPLGQSDDEKAIVAYMARINSTTGA